MNPRGPAHLFLAWAVHDVEEAIAFPGTCGSLADTTGIEALRLDQRQSWLAVGLMGVLAAFACRRGRTSEVRSRLYRATVAGLHAHVATHLLASLLQRSYTAGVATALPVMLPGAESARREIRDSGRPLRTRDYLAGAALLIPAALACQVLARVLIRRSE
ncbi:HXXEE domain-containing protein [Leucobacter ruminantium]|uniref:HXXEE domain-containing protein n=1 Tax=Leucobacter ruminantium TaxID=1289170 RepID=A0A939RYG1_9MICO|nr:HXXEE domain-containing protein [Leucobacter ruminantium]MBO1805673.1 HXXEE domain-containing protein [Leucobacter ruminantium]